MQMVFGSQIGVDWANSGVRRTLSAYYWHDRSTRFVEYELDADIQLCLLQQQHTTDRPNDVLFRLFVFVLLLYYPRLSINFKFVA